MANAERACFHCGTLTSERAAIFRNERAFCCEGLPQIGQRRFGRSRTGSLMSHAAGGRGHPAVEHRVARPFEKLHGLMERQTHDTRIGSRDQPHEGLSITLGRQTAVVYIDGETIANEFTSE